MKKLPLVLFGLLSFSTNSFSQYFSLEHSEMTTSTPGFENDFEYVELQNLLHNEHSAPITFQWELLNYDELPTGFNVIGFCDNQNCYTSLNFATTTTFTSNPVAVDGSSILRLDMNVVNTTPPSTFTLKVEVTYDTQVDTAYYTIVKEPLGMTVIPVDDERVNIYPNPAASSLNLFVNDNLNADRATFYNIMGQEMKSISVKDTETQNIDITGLPGGTYIIKISDNQGKVITNRRFVKG